MAKTTAIHAIYCPWCHAPLVFIEAITLTLDADARLTADRYDCAGRPSHTVLVMARLD